MNIDVEPNEKFVLKKAMNKSKELRQILYQAFTNCPSLYSVYSAGSYYTKNFDFRYSDIDLSLIVEKPSFKDIHTLEENISRISKKSGIKISTCYSEINDLKEDIKIFKAHAHGKKRTSFLYDILISFVIAKTTLLLKGIYTSQKEDIINSFSKNIDAQLGYRLLTISNKSKKELQSSKEEKSADLQFIMDFCYFCKDYSRGLVKVNQNEFKPIPKVKK